MTKTLLSFHTRAQKQAYELAGIACLAHAGKRAWHDGNSADGRSIQEYASGDSYDGWWYKSQCSGLRIYYFADGSNTEGPGVMGSTALAAQVFMASVRLKQG
eukprot:s11414_g1.t1